VADGEVGNPEHATVQFGDAAIRQTVVTFRDLTPSERVLPSPEKPDHKGEGTASFEKYYEREIAWQQAFEEVDFMTPSLLQSSRAKRIRHTEPGNLKLPGQYLGTLVHRLLEQWDFHLYPENFREPLRKFCLKEFPRDLDDDEKNAVMLEIEDLMGTFLQSSSYRELQQATILGREIPFAMPWSHQGQTGSTSFPCVMEGVMDVVFEMAGNVWVGDYKTDRVTAAQLGDYARVYQLQAQVYGMKFLGTCQDLQVKEKVSG